MTTPDKSSPLIHEAPINKPVTLITIYDEAFKPGYISIKLRGHFKDFDKVDMMLFLEDYKAQIGFDEEQGQKVFYYMNISQEHVKEASAALLRGLHGLDLMQPKQLEQAREELKIPEHLPVKQSGFTDRELARMRRQQTDRAAITK